MHGLLLAVLLGASTAAPADTVTIKAPSVDLRAAYALPAGPAAGPAIAGLHGCGGPYPAGDDQWRGLFVAAGRPVLMPDNFGSRGLGSQCETADRSIRSNGKRRTDAVAAVRWLTAQPGTPPGGVVVIGWSNGGGAVLAAAAPGVMPPNAVRGFVAFQPGCRAYADRPDWSPSALLLIIMSEADDWTPAEPAPAGRAVRQPGQARSGAGRLP